MTRKEANEKVMPEQAQKGAAIGLLEFLTTAVAPIHCPDT